jgi:hypothetical protein
MPYHHRQEGYTIRDRIMEGLTWRNILDILNRLVTLPFAIQQLHLPHVHALVAEVTATRQLLWDAVDPVDPGNSNRDVDSFTPSESVSYKTFIRNFPRHYMFFSFSYLSISSDRFVLVSIPLTHFLYHMQGCHD